MSTLSPNFVPSIPQAVPTVTFGDPIEGTEVIAARVVPGKRGAGERGAGEQSAKELRGTADRSTKAVTVDLAADGTWVATLPTEPQRRIDLTEGKDFLDDGWRTAGAHLVRRVNTVIAGHPVKAKKHVLQVELPAKTSASQIRSLVIGLTVGGHTFVSSNRRQPARTRNIHLTIAGSTSATKSSHAKGLAQAVEYGAVLGAATCLSKDLANMPSNVKTPEWLSQQAKKLVGSIEGVKVKIRDAEWLEAKGFGGILAVGKGSENPPALIELVWDPEKAGIARKKDSLVLVGKGVTFDTGGINVKPASNMASMMTDMTGGASVIAAFRAVAQAQIPRKVVALIPTAENMVSGRSYRPGDVVEHFGGITSEIGNTDAEGRLLLADALSYGAKKFKPAMMVSLATLTGAAKVALGLRTGAVFTSEWSSAVKLARRGAVVGENWWPMPQPAYLEDSINSKVADVKQTPSGPGATTAAMFLRRFTRNVPLMHLDIAGPGRSETTFDEVTPLGTGFGARTLVQWLRS